MIKNVMAEDKKKKLKLGFRTSREVLDEYVPDIPITAAGKLTRTIMRLSTMKCPAKFNYGFKKRDMKGRQVLILSQHTSRDDPYYVNAGYPFIQPNAIMSRHNVLIPVFYRLLLKDGVILKSLFEPDTAALRQMMRLYKKGASFLLFPEGVQSVCGFTQPIHPATARLIKKLAMDTVLCTSHGAYLCNPRFDTNKRRGRLEYNYDILFTKEELKELSEEELYERLLKAFRYNDFEWNSKKQFRYKGKVPCAHGIDKLLFVCPRCKRQYEMHVEGDRLLCSCGSAVTIDECYNLIPDDKDFPFKRIDEWYLWERDVIAEETSREDFRLEYDVEYKMLNEGNLFKGSYVKVGEGKLLLDREHLRYNGTRNGEPVELVFDISRVPSMTVTRSMANELYYDGVYHQFPIKGDKPEAIKMMSAVEILHDAGDPERSKARKDVEEGYQRGESV